MNPKAMFLADGLNVDICIISVSQKQIIARCPKLVYDTHVSCRYSEIYLL